MRLLPIYWTKPPTPEDWARLTEAREAIGYTDVIKPVQALQGSPGTLLVIGEGRPSWLQNFYACNDITDKADLMWALDGALRMEGRAEAYSELLSSWMGVEVSSVGEEEHDGSVG